jgi:hypothetical protein
MLFEKTPINQLFSEIDRKNAGDENRNQLMLFNL